MQKVKVAYICDQKKKCRWYGACRKFCRHTFDEFHTLNGVIHNVDELKTDRFKEVITMDETTYYAEVEKDDSIYL